MAGEDTEWMDAPMGPYSSLKRPWCCPEQRCRVVYQYSDNPDLSKQEAGDSFSCFGEMERPVAFVYDGVPHENNLNSCHYTPLKGLIRWQENRDDWMLLSRMYATALKQLTESEGNDG